MSKTSEHTSTFEPQSLGWTRTGKRKSIVASTESSNCSRSQTRKTSQNTTFVRSPAPSPPASEERERYEKEQQAKKKG